MGFAQGYVNGKVYSLGIAVVFAVIGFLLLDSGYCGPEKTEVGDTIRCFYTTRPVTAGEKLDMEMLELRDTVVETEDYRCIHNIMGIKGEKFSREVEPDSILTHSMLVL